jgi:hypothetical protein
VAVQLQAHAHFISYRRWALVPRIGFSEIGNLAGAAKANKLLMQLWSAAAASYGGEVVSASAGCAFWTSQITLSAAKKDAASCDAWSKSSWPRISEMTASALSNLPDLASLCA